MSFSEKIRKTAEANRSRTVLALDLEEHDPKQLMLKSEELLQKVGKHICAVKINRQLAMSLGMRGGIDRMVELAHDLALPAIMDETERRRPHERIHGAVILRHRFRRHHSEPRCWMGKRVRHSVRPG